MSTVKAAKSRKRKKNSMPFIKLTDANPNAKQRTLYINPYHIVSYFPKEDGTVTLIMTSDMKTYEVIELMSGVTDLINEVL